MHFSLDGPLCLVRDHWLKLPNYVIFLPIKFKEHSGSVVEYITWDWAVVESSLTGKNVLCPWARHYPLYSTGSTQEMFWPIWKAITYNWKTERISSNKTTNKFCFILSNSWDTDKKSHLSLRIVENPLMGTLTNSEDHDAMPQLVIIYTLSEFGYKLVIITYDPYSYTSDHPNCFMNKEGQFNQSEGEVTYYCDCIV